MGVLVCHCRDLAYPPAGEAEVHIRAVVWERIALGREAAFFGASAEGRPDREGFDGLQLVCRGGRYSVCHAARRAFEREGRGYFDPLRDEVHVRPFLTLRYVNDLPVFAVVLQVWRGISQYEMPFPIALVGRSWLGPRWLRARGATKRQAMARAEFVVATPACDGWGPAVTEPAKVGTPTIAHGLPGLRDSVRASGVGLVVPSVRHLAARVVDKFPQWEHTQSDNQAGDVGKWGAVTRQLLAVSKHGHRVEKSEVA